MGNSLFISIQNDREYRRIIDHMTPEAIVTRCSKITVLESTMFNVENVGEFCTEDALQVSLML